MINAQLLQSMVDASNDGIVVAEQEGDDTILIYVNAAFERLTGYSRDEILYQIAASCRPTTVTSLAAPASARPWPKAARAAVLRNYRKDGSAFWNELSITPVRHDAEQRTYFIGIQKDVTRQVELERELAELRVRPKPDERA